MYFFKCQFQFHITDEGFRHNKKEGWGGGGVVVKSRAERKEAARVMRRGADASLASR